MNKATLIAVLTRTAVLASTASSTPVVNFTLSGETTSGTRSSKFFVPCVAFGRVAERIAALPAGTVLVVHPEINLQKWEDASGKHSKVVLKVLSFETLEGAGAQLGEVGGAPYLHSATNEVTLSGNLGREVDLRYTQSGDPVASVSVALSERYRGKSGEMEERTHWIDVVAWRDEALKLAGVGRGQKVLIRGSFKTESWDDATTGAKRSKLLVEASEVQALAASKAPTGEKVGAAKG